MELTGNSGEIAGGGLARFLKEVELSHLYGRIHITGDKPAELIVVSGRVAVRSVEEAGEQLDEATGRRHLVELLCDLFRSASGSYECVPLTGVPDAHTLVTVPAAKIVMEALLKKVSTADDPDRPPPERAPLPATHEDAGDSPAEETLAESGPGDDVVREGEVVSADELRRRRAAALGASIQVGNRAALTDEVAPLPSAPVSPPGAPGRPPTPGPASRATDRAPISRAVPARPTAPAARPGQTDEAATDARPSRRGALRKLISVLKN